MKIYIQIADGRQSYPVKASTKKPLLPISTGSGVDKKFLPTVTFAIDAKFDRSLFRDSIEALAEFELTKETIQTPAPVVDIIEVDKHD